MKPINRHAQQGASLVHWLIALLALLSFGALAIDINNLFLAQAELQNAADAGAIEGARLLYCPPGTTGGEINHAGTCKDASNSQINDRDGNALPSANNAATAAALQNASQGSAVEVVSVERGHWEFMTTNYQDAAGIERGGLFTANNTQTPASLTDGSGNFRTFGDLNTDPNEINAVRVVVARQSTPISATFSRLLGINNFQGRAEAVAYVGFAGTLNPGEVDWPIAMCLEYVSGSCNVGRFMSDNEDTGGWTNFEQPGQGAGSCSGGASASDVKKIINDSQCTGLNTTRIVPGWDMQTSNGQVQSAFKPTFDCFVSNGDTNGDGLAEQPWKWVLPVIDCNPKPGGRCNTVLGAVQVEVLWIIDKENKIDKDAPKAMTATNGTTWSSSDTDGQNRWDSFASTFGLQEPDGTTAQWRKKSIYFRPSCEDIDLGGSGGANFGIRSAIPVLVN